MFDRATAYQLARLRGLLCSDDAKTRSEARTAIDAILARHNISYDVFQDWMSTTAGPWIACATVAGLPSYTVRPDIRRDAVWRPIPADHDSSLGFATLFPNGVVGRVGPDPRTPSIPMWLADIDGHLLREHGEVVRFTSAEQAMEMVERVAKRLFQDPAWKIAIDLTRTL